VCDVLSHASRGCVRVELLDAATIGNAGEVETALGKGASVNTSNGKTKRTSLHCAAMNGHIEVVQVLCAAGADLNARDSLEITPLFHAARNGHAIPYVEIAQVLLAAGADVNAKSPSLSPPRAESRSLSRSRVSGSVPLHSSSSNGHIEMVQVLLAAGADVNARNNSRLIAPHAVLARS